MRIMSSGNRKTFGIGKAVGETAERNELILYATWDARRRRYWIDVVEATHWPPSYGAVAICRIDREDRGLMVEWAAVRARAGWTPRRLRRAILK